MFYIFLSNIYFDKPRTSFEEKDADLVSFGTLFIANPDLVERFDQQIPLAAVDQSSYYSGDEKGYTDYPPAAKL